MKTTGWNWAILLALTWALCPVAPALARGELIGHGLTDLFPSVWGLWWFVQEQPGLPSYSEQLAAPEGMGFYYSSPIRGWLAWPFLKILSLTQTWNLLVILARLSTVLCAFGAARAWKLSVPGALFAAAVYGASPYFHGYTVEGIVEGQDGWALALYLWALAKPRRVVSGLALGLTLWTGWYAGATACVFGAMMGRRGWWSLWGIALALPALAQFGGAFPEASSIPSDVRASMGATLGPWVPGVLSGLNPFAKTNWLGLLAPALALTQIRRRPRLAAMLAVFAVLSFGIGPWYAVPPFSELRFPYRFHAGTLACLALLAGSKVDSLPREPHWIAFLVVLEGLLLSPVEPVVPSAIAEVPAIYAEVGPGPVLDIPGPLSFPPGVENPTRERARNFLYAQTLHSQPTVWRPGFNGVGTKGIIPPWLEGISKLDPLITEPSPSGIEIPLFVETVVVHKRGLSDTFGQVTRLIQGEGFSVAASDGERLLLRRSGHKNDIP